MAMFGVGLRTHRWGMELLLALTAGVVFLGSLGAIDVWGKREQRAAAEALDTIQNQRWLVARIQDRPRLEKPPLPRWTIAGLMWLTGRRDEWVVRLPSALSALGTVALVYALGCRLGGRAVGLSSGFALTSLPFFVTEMRQSGNDGPLVFFTTLALYTAWMRLNGGRCRRGEATSPFAGEVDGRRPSVDGDQAPSPSVLDTNAPGPRAWTLLMYTALGLGCLTKGPIVILLAGMTVVPYLALDRRLRRGIGLLADGWGLLLFVGLGLCWPVPVVLRDPNAVNVWLLEMGQKAGTAGIPHKHAHPMLIAAWPWMTLPWAVIASIGALRPFFVGNALDRRSLWFPWWWSVGNLAMFSAWPVAKPNYFLPCLPGVALLVGLQWVVLVRAAREPIIAWRARRLLQAHWIALLAVGLAAPIAAWRLGPQYVGWAWLFGALVTAAVGVSFYAWRRGAEAATIAPLCCAIAPAVLIAFGAIAPDFNEKYSHRGLAADLERVVPAHSPTIMFFDEVDEGIWFYLRERALAAVPDSQPRYNSAFARSEDLRNNRLELDPNKRLRNKTEALRSWLVRGEHPSPYLLMRRSLFEQMSPRLGGLVTPIYREDGLSRYAMVLLRVTVPDAVLADRDGPAPRTN